MSWKETPQQAIEGYLDALLQDDNEQEQAEKRSEGRGDHREKDNKTKAWDAASDKAFYEEAGYQEESFQGRHLSESLARVRQATAQEPQYSPPVAEAERQPQVVMPELSLAQEPDLQVETETQAAEPETETLPEEAFEASAEALEQETKKEEETTPATTQLEAPAQPPSPPGWKDGRPVWAQERFECLLFKVKGLTLAVPLVELGGIIKIDREPTPLFGQPDWFLGMLRANNINVSMVDTAQWVLPSALINKNPDPYKLIIRIHDSTWGLACNEVDRSISLQPDQVRWRTSLGKRPWLAGTVIEHMCALIDVSAFDRLLKEGHGHLEPANLAALKALDTEN